MEYRKHSLRRFNRDNGRRNRLLSIVSALVALMCDDNGERQYFVELLSFYFFAFKEKK